VQCNWSKGELIKIWGKNVLSYWLCYICSLVKLVKFLFLCYRMLCFWWIKIVKKNQRSRSESDHVWETFFSPLYGIHRYILIKLFTVTYQHAHYDIDDILRSWTRSQGHRKYFLKMHFSGKGVSIDSLPSNII